MIFQPRASHFGPTEPKAQLLSPRNLLLHGRLKALGEGGLSKPGEPDLRGLLQPEPGGGLVARQKS